MKQLWQRCMALQDDAAAHGFDWPDTAQVLDKLREELDELAVAPSSAAQREELGDVLFVLTNLTRRLGIDAEAALDEARRKFERRYAFVMADADSLPPLGDPRRLDAMEARWQRAKREDGASG